MALLPGTRIGVYEVVAQIGEGGMGQVYRARDTRLGREVALKILTASFSGDPDRLMRFEREAKTLASLNHSGIAAIYGIEEPSPGSGQAALVMELVEGEELTKRIAGKPMPLDEALPIARQIVEALEAAHGYGIIHRDLKPANIKVRADGTVKVLDFGLAKAVEQGSGIGDQGSAANSPTMTSPALTAAGIILGTAAYMSPEQAKGRPVDKRTDVWAFGCVLFEMLTGKRAFEGEDVTEILAAIVRGEPDWTALPADLPGPIREVVERSLVKDRADRLSDMSVVRYLLNQRAQPAVSPAPPAVARPRGMGWPLTAALVVAAIAATAIVMRWLPGNESASPSRITHLAIPLPVGDQVAYPHLDPLAISHDGSTIVYSALRQGAVHLYVRALADPEPRQLAGTDGGRGPFLSPDGQWIGFFAAGKLKKIGISGAGLQVLADANDGRGGWWSADDLIYFAPTNQSGIWRVAASGGTAAEVTRLDTAAGEISHMWPQVLSDQIMVFLVRNGPGIDEHVIVRHSLASGERHILFRGGKMPRHVASGHLVYARVDTLFAAPWTPPQTELGRAVPAALPQLPRTENEGASAFVVSDNGTLAYVAGGPERTRNRLVWIDRAGVAKPLPLAEKEYESVVLSPDGRHAIVQIVEGTVTLWNLDLERQTMTPFVVSGGSSQAPVWTSDGQRIIYRGTRSGFRNLYWKAADGAGTEERLTTKPDVVQAPTSVSSDGKWLLYSEGFESIWLLALEPGADRTPKRLLPPGARDTDGQFSPDGRWVAYVSSISGREEVYVRPFPDLGARTPVSTAGADQPRWSRDGRELYFRALDGKLMVVDVTTKPGFKVSVPGVRYNGLLKETVNLNTPFDISADGRAFIVQPGQAQNDLTRIEVVLNWFAQLSTAK